MVVFSEDPQKWPLPSSRYVASTNSNESGAFRVAGLPPGRYLAAALFGVDPMTAADAATLARLAARAETVDVQEGGRATVTLRIR